MDNFDKLFQDKLNEINENDFEFKESSWERFHNNLEAENATVKRVVPMLWLKRNAAAAAIVLLLLMSNVFFAKQFLSNRSNVKALTETVETLTNEIVTCQENSAFANENQNQNQNQNENENENKNDGSNDLTMTSNGGGFGLNNNYTYYNNRNNVPFVIPKFSNENETTNEIENNAVNHTNQQQPNNNTAINSNSSDGETPKPSNETVIKQTNNLAITNIDRLNLLLNNENQADEKWWKTPEVSGAGGQKVSFGARALLLAEAAKPKDFQIGAAAQFSNVSTSSGIPSIRALNVGLSGNTLFFNRLRLQAGAEKWTQFIYFDNIETAADGIYGNVLSDLTTLNPHNPQDELTKLEGQIHGFDIPLSAEILLRPDAKWNPYVGFGIVGRYFGNYKMEQYFYEYGNTVYRYEMKDIGKVKQFDLSLWQTKVGLDFNLSQHWLLNAELTYMKNYREQVFGLKNVQQFGGRLGVKYQF